MTGHDQPARRVASAQLCGARGGPSPCWAGAASRGCEAPTARSAGSEAGPNSCLVESSGPKPKTRRWEGLSSRAAAAPGKRSASGPPAHWRRVTAAESLARGICCKQILRDKRVPAPSTQPGPPRPISARTGVLEQASSVEETGVQFLPNLSLVANAVCDEREVGEKLQPWRFDATCLLQVFALQKGPGLSSRCVC